MEVLGSREGRYCGDLVLARGVPPVTARLLVVSFNDRVIGGLLYAVSSLMEHGKY